jgi:hypothetical protein
MTLLVVLLALLTDNLHDSGGLLDRGRSLALAAVDTIAELVAARLTATSVSSSPLSSMGSAPPGARTGARR